MRGKRGFWFGTFSVLAISGLLFILLIPDYAGAAINQQIGFQGKLTNPDGTNVVDGNYSIRFRIYTDATLDALNACLPGSNTCKWEDSQTITVNDGIFYYALGSNGGAPLPGSVDFNVTGLYLGVKVNTDTEMTPRVRLTSSPYAFNSNALGGIASSGYVQLSPGAQQSGDINISGTIASGAINGVSVATALDGFTVAGGTTSRTLTVTGADITIGNTIRPTSAGSLAVQSNGANPLTLTSGAAATWSTSAGNLTVQAAGTNILALNTVGAGTVNVGTANTTTIGIGNSTASTTVSIIGGTGASAISIQAGAAGTIAIGDSSAGTIRIGNTSGAVSQSITIGNNASLGATSTIVIGSTIGTSATTINAGSGGVTVNANVAISTGKNLSITGGNTALTGPAAGSSQALVVNTSVASNVGIRVNTTGAAANAFEINASGVGITAAFDNAGDLILGTTGAASGAVLTPDTSAAATTTSNLFLVSGNSTTSGGTGSVTLQSGDATSGTSGNVAIDNGSSSTGTPQVNLGTVNARSVRVGNTSATTTVAVLAGAGTSVFTLQGPSLTYLQLDTTNNRIYVGSSSGDTTGVLLVLGNKTTTGDPAAGTTGAMYYNTADGEYRAYQSTGWSTIQPIRYAYTSSDISKTTTTYTDVTGLTFAVAANKDYEIKCSIIYRSALTTTGIGIALNGPASPTLVAGQFTSNSTATAFNGRSFNAYNGTGKTTGVQVANTDTYGLFNAYFRNGATAGTLALRYASEIGGSSVTIRTGSYCRLAEM